MTGFDGLPSGTPIEGWGGTVAPDHNHLGLLDIGPQPATAGWTKRIGTQVATEQPLPPDIAALCLTRAAQRTKIKRSIALRQSSGQKLQPLVLGRKRYA